MAPSVGTAVMKKRADYTPPLFWTREVSVTRSFLQTFFTTKLKQVQLDFDIHEDFTNVRSQLHCERGCGSEGQSLALNGQRLKLNKVAVDGKSLGTGDFDISDDHLTIKTLPTAKKFIVEIEVTIDPANNTTNTGMYGKELISTQCEAETFRLITYMLDRPDVMARYTRVRIEADKAKYPILLSNGNLIESGESGQGRHFVVWQDPFPKPSYLFALVAGNLGVLKDEYTTMSGRKVRLQLWSDPRDVDSLRYAMESVKQAMKWDEDTFGLEYDLDLFNVVAIRDFNMGAMENKGLNIFRTSLLLADSNTATDDNYERIQSVVAHEYFHNWTGDRVTCRDWFQLTLKEGLTVFRDQSFSEDVSHSIGKRIETVRLMKGGQFPEDGGPLAHPIRPESYVCMDNFYTRTVYYKGAEVIRMIQTIIGKQAFRKGMDLYFARHDGCAVTCEDFVNAMADASGVDLTQFFLWYSTAGTPVIEASGQYDEAAKRYSLTLKQSIPPTPGQPTKPALHIPVVTGLLSSVDGKELVPSKLLELKSSEVTFHFDGIAARPVPSLLRHFSAPVKLRFDQSDEDLATLIAHDTDTFNRWDSGQRLASRIIQTVMHAIEKGQSPEDLVPAFFVKAFCAVVEDQTIEKSLQAFTLTLPTLSILIEELAPPVNLDALYAAREHVLKTLARAAQSQLLKAFHALAPPAGYKYEVNTASIGRRRMRGLALNLLCKIHDPTAAQLAVDLVHSATCLTERMQALTALSSIGGDSFEKALQFFYDVAAGNQMVIDKWFSVQAMADLPDVIDRIRQKLLAHPEFSYKNVQRTQATVMWFTSANIARFHDREGEGYRLLADVIIDLDKVNPQVSGIFVSYLALFRKLDSQRQANAKRELQRLLSVPNISKNVQEVASKSLA